MNDKPFEEKNILERHTYNKPEGGHSVNIGAALCELDLRIKSLEDQIKGIGEAMEFFVKWYNETQRVNILVPEHLANNGENKLLL